MPENAVFGGLLVRKRLYHKYSVQKSNGEPIDPEAQYFVLRIDTDPAARAALRTYADGMERVGEDMFADQLREWVRTFTEEGKSEAA